MKRLIGLLLAVVCWQGAYASTFPNVSITKHLAESQVNLKSMVQADGMIPEDSLQILYRVIGLDTYGLSYNVFRYGMIGFCALREEGKLNQRNILTVIDFTKSSRKKRFFTIDLDSMRVLFNTYVSHGKNTGEDMATNFSNIVHSNQSSIGFYVTGETYVGSKGYSLRLDGVEEKFNANLRTRAVVVHGADYVSEQWINKYGRLGRSQGCPALPSHLSKEVIDVIKDRTAIFAYYNDNAYLQSSSYLNFHRLVASTDEEETGNSSERNY